MRNHAFCALFVLGMFSASAANAGVDSLSNGSNVRPVSQYGLIQNVQNYSTNPFWNSNSLYNQKMPQAVYAQGADLNTADCQNTVGVLVAAYCSANSDCVGLRLADVRPVIMLQLSRLPGHNYASACSGFIDSEFDSYVAKYSNAIPTNKVAFPVATVANPNYDTYEFKLENPYEIKDSTWQGDEWKKEKRERSQELKDLQSQNGVGSEHLARAAFPSTYSDLSFSERMEITKEGYEPFKDGSAYSTISVEDQDEYDKRHRKTSSSTNNAPKRTKIVLNYKIMK